MPTYTLRSDSEVDAALNVLGATPGNRSRVIREAILALAIWQSEGKMPPSAVRDFVAVAQIQRDLDGIKGRLNDLMVRKVAT